MLSLTYSICPAWPLKERKTLESNLLVQDNTPPWADVTNFFHSTVMWMDALTSCFHWLIKVLCSTTDLSYLINFPFPRGNKTEHLFLLKHWVKYHKVFLVVCLLSFFYMDSFWPRCWVVCRHPKCSSWTGIFGNEAVSFCKDTRYVIFAC